jgi:hypothetical protein
MKYNIKINNSKIVTIDTGKAEIIYIEIGEFENIAKNKYVRIVLDNGSSKIFHYLEETNFKDYIDDKNKDNMKFITSSRSKLKGNKMITIERISDEV